MREIKMRNPLISALKMFAMVVIIVGHCNVPENERGLFENYPLFVDFFFVLEGYFLYNKIKLEELPNLYKRHLKKYFGYVPLVFISSFLTWLTKYLLGKRTFSDAKWILLDTSLLGEVINGGGYKCYIQGASWFLSASFISLLILLPILKKVTNWCIDPILGFIGMATYTCIVVVYGSTNCWSYCLLGTGIVRAVAGILVGFSIYGCHKILEDVFNKKIEKMLLLACLIFITYIAVLGEASTYEPIKIFVFGLSIVLADKNVSYVKSPVLIWVEKAELIMYLFQVIVIDFINFFMEINWGACFVIVMSDLVISFFVMKINVILRGRILKNFVRQDK